MGMKKIFNVVVLYFDIVDMLVKEGLQMGGVWGWCGLYWVCIYVCLGVCGILYLRLVDFSNVLFFMNFVLLG